MTGEATSTLIVQALADATRSEGARADLLLAAQKAVDVHYSKAHPYEMQKAINALADAINRVRRL